MGLVWTAVMSVEIRMKGIKANNISFYGLVSDKMEKSLVADMY